MSFETLLDMLGKRPQAESLELVNLMLHRLENMLKEPSDLKHRTFSKSDSEVVKNVLHSSTGIHCLKLLNCIEQPAYFFVPQNCNLQLMKDLQDTLAMWKDSVEQNSSEGQSSSGEQEIIKPIVLMPLTKRYTHPFLGKIETIFHSCQRYANKAILERAKKLIPLTVLEDSAQKRLRDYQHQMKLSKEMKSLEISIQDMLILELLEWFKESFFTWVNSPSCDFCSAETKFSHMTHDKKYCQYTNRVELHRCTSCHQFTPFARYEDLNILLETRRGRCGEWANVFTLFCRSMGWDARIVFDETDHVWTEVYSIAQQRWLHCDSCENICDQPLIYEFGWKKPISYVIAYSNEEVQDVTWRYTSDFKQALKRRTMCEESALINTLLDLRARRQQRLSEARRKYLTKRALMELLEFLTEKKPGEEDGQGRQSGNLSWRLTRGEFHDTSSSIGFTWKIDPEKLALNRASLFYSPVKDAYQLVSGNQVMESQNGWASGCHEFDNVFRKEEKDWKQVYLARKENGKDGTITWKFEFPESSPIKVERVAVRFSCAIYENATIRAQVGCDDIVEDLVIDSTVFKSDKFAGKTKIWVKATLSGGKGDVAWQHAQLFRQSLDSDSFPFAVAFTFK